ncbi:synaptojanin-2-binding protein-like [Dendronephthya gigantea]|uniref:synaptojanin-2-binding protein-like n=1 Tax=Dendronephthya gigantea TaxID=151771 RepID=UPI00106D5B83|nr:synaptojanin-2-binding protein-like [Dendronephthya gigantea]
MSSGEEPEQDIQPGTVLEVRITRNPGEGFGLNIVGGIDSREIGNNTSIFISSINTYGPAASCGQLDVGDRLLQINEFSLIGVTHSDAVDAFRNAGTTIILRIEKFAQQLLVAKLSTDNVQCSATFGERMRNFMNSWAGAVFIGTTAGALVMYTVSKYWKFNLK